jgi:nucleoside-diphosphate kinase
MESEVEYSFVIMKPDAMERGLVGAIIGRFEQVGLRIVAARVCKASRELLGKHYPDSLAPIIGQKSKAAGTDVGNDATAYGREVLRWNQEYMMRGPVLALIIEGLGAVQRIRDIIGSTNPPKAAPGTVRFDYGVDSIEKANEDQRGTENLVHASGSKDEAASEVALWFPEFKP